MGAANLRAFNLPAAYDPAGVELPSACAASPLALVWRRGLNPRASVAGDRKLLANDFGLAPDGIPPSSGDRVNAILLPPDSDCKPTVGDRELVFVDGLLPAPMGGWGRALIISLIP